MFVFGDLGCVFGDGGQVGVYVVFVLGLEIGLVSVEAFQFGLDDEALVLLLLSTQVPFAEFVGVGSFSFFGRLSVEALCSCLF